MGNPFSVGNKEIFNSVLQLLSATPGGIWQCVEVF
jgi:hypothetical protein